MVERACYAKINLALAVGPPRGPAGPGAGLHPICSWMCCVGLADTLAIERAARTRYTRRWADGSAVNWPEDEDLAVRAHRALEADIGRTLPVELNLTKSIPPGGGLGGGSSNAAGVLLALRELFDLDVPIESLRQIVATLGSDIPYFIDQRATTPPAIVTGVGDAIERVDRLDARVMLILPPFGCPTGAVYRAFDVNPPSRPFSAASADIVQAARSQDLSLLFNGLRDAAEAVRPELGVIRRMIERETGETVHLSGSGSTLFLLDPEADAASIARIAPGCRVVPTRTL